MFLFMGLCFGISALGLIGGAVWAYFKQQQTMESRVMTTGTVVELTESVTASGRASMLCPVVEFTTVTERSSGSPQSLDRARRDIRLVRALMSAMRRLTRKRLRSSRR